MFVIILIKNNVLPYRLNTAEIGAMSRDIPYEAKIMVKRMISDSMVNITHHWKVNIYKFVLKQKILINYI